MEKKKVMFVTQKKVAEEFKFKLQDRNLERVQVSGMWFKERDGDQRKCYIGLISIM